MQKPSVIVSCLLVVLVTGGCTEVQSPTTTPPATTSPSPSANVGQSTSLPATTSPSPSPTQKAQTPTDKTVQIYFLQSKGTHFEVVPTPVRVQDSNQPSVILEDAFKHLITGPTDTKVTTTIPRGTKLLSVQVRNDGVHIDLSQEFTTGGGSASMTGRVAQVLYTATSLNPDAKVWINIDGKKLDVLGGEGLELEQPLTRKEFQKDFQL